MFKTFRKTLLTAVFAAVALAGCTQTPKVTASPLAAINAQTTAADMEDMRRACINGSVSTVKDLLARGFNPNVVLAGGDTPLTLAFRSESWQTVKTLLDTPVTDCSMANGLGETPLMMSVFKGRTEEFEDLLKRGCEINKPGWTPLHYAATEGRLDMMRRLIDMGADVNAMSNAGVTPLDMAARRPSRQAADLLLKAGARKDLCTQKGLSAADFARNAGDDQLAEQLFVERCANTVKALQKNRVTVKVQ